MEKFKNNKKYLILLLLICLVGVFLRTYNFNEWLIVQGDQTRDLTIVTNVISGQSSLPLLGPDMSGGNGFHLGPIYYYFQIIAAKIFGISASVQAYPDVFFSILSIPLLYYLLTRYFKKDIALLTTALYAVSYYDIAYSRFAWNVNLIPFFSMLFVLAFWQLLVGKQKTAWQWILLFGFSLGVGVQLHAILLVIFGLMTLAAFVFLIYTNPRIWKKCLTIMLIALFLNFGQLISEQRSNFANTKAFFQASNYKSGRESSDLFKGFSLDLACSAQASEHAISGLGNNKLCNFLYSSALKSTTYSTGLTLNHNTPLELVEKFVGALFLLFGLGLLATSFWQETNLDKKYFLGTILLYEILFFIVMFPIAPGSRMRYFLPIMFIPFVFLSLISERFIKKFPRFGWKIIVLVFVLLILLNINAIRLEVIQLLIANKDEIV